MSTQEKMDRATLKNIAQARAHHPLDNKLAQEWAVYRFRVAVWDVMAEFRAALIVT